MNDTEPVETIGSNKATEIERLREENRQLRGILIGIEKAGSRPSPGFSEDGEVDHALIQATDAAEPAPLQRTGEREHAAWLEAEQRAAGILDRMTDALLVLDREWRICFMNQEAARLNGKPPEAFLGKTHWEEWPASVGTPLEAAYRRAMADQVAVHLEHHYQDADHDLWLEINAYPTTENLGIFYRDIRDRKQAEQALRHSEERFHAAVLAVGDIVWTNTPSGQMEGEQAGWAAFTGQNYETYQGYGWAQAVHPADAPSTIAAWNEAVAARKLFVFEHRLRRHDGVWRVFSIRAAPVLNGDGSIREWVGVHTDITERRETELEIRTFNERLRNAMRETHHRVKNNLQVIAAMIDMQVLEHGDEQTVPLQEFERLKTHVSSLSIVHDLLTLNVKDEEDAQRLSAKAVLGRLLPMLQQTTGTQSVRYAIEEAELSTRQCIALSFVVNELVSNALKHGGNEADVSFAVDDWMASLTVSDDGGGFPEYFNPVKAARLGLELVSNLVHMDLQGTIVYRNRSTHGGKVIVTFPLTQEEE